MNQRATQNKDLSPLINKSTLRLEYSLSTLMKQHAAWNKDLSPLINQ